MSPRTSKTLFLSLSMLLMGACFTLWGCAAGVASHLSPDYAERKPRSIAVLPIGNDTGEPLTAPASHAYLKGLLERAFLSDDKVATDPPSSFRRQVHYILYKKDYRVPSLETLDERVGHRHIQDLLQLPAAEAKTLLDADSVLYGAITGWDTRRLKTDNTVMVGVSFKLVDLETHAVLWEGEKPYSSVSIKATQPWHDVRYYISRVVSEVFATLPNA